MSSHKKRKVLKINDEDDLIPKSIIYEDPELNTKIENDITNNIYLLVKAKASEGSIMNSIVTLILFSPICTFFYVPFALSFYLMIPGIIIFILTALLSYYTLFLLLKVIVEKQAMTHTYTQLISSLLSKKLCIMMNILIIIYFFGLSIIYIYIGKELIANLASRWFQNSSKWLTSLVTQIVGIVLFEILFALITKTTLTKLLHSLAIFSLFLLFITHIITIFSKGFQLKTEITGDIYQIGNLGSIASLGLTNHLYYNKGLRNMSLFSQKRGKSLIIWSVFGELFFYILFNLVFGLQKNINHKDPLLGYFKLEGNFFVQMFSVLLFIFIQFKVSNIWSSLIEILFFQMKKENENLPTPITFNYSTKYWTIIFGIVWSNFVAFWFNLDDTNPTLVLIVIWIVGGLCASVLSFFLPIILYLKVFPQTPSAIKIFQILIFVICLILVGVEFVSAILTISVK